MTQILSHNTLDNFIKKNKLADESLIKFLKDTNYSTKDLASYQQYLKDTGKATSTFSSITQKAGNVVKGFAAGLASMAVMWAISEAIGFVVTKINDLASATENAVEASNQVAQSISNSINSYSENSKKISDLNIQYQGLSKGVDSLGRVTTLTSSEYEKYKDVISQISELMPELTVKFNEQGEKIGFVQGKLQDLNKTYQEQQIKNAKNMLSNGDKNGNTLSDTLKAYQSQKELKTSEKVGYNLQNFFKLATQGFKMDMNDVDGLFSTEEIIAKIEKMQSISKDKLIDSLKKKSKSALTEDLADVALFGASKKELNNMTDESFNSYMEGLNGKLDTYKEKLEAQVSDMRMWMMEITYANEDFHNLNGNNGTLITNILSSLSKDFIDENGLTTESAMRTFINRLVESTKVNSSQITPLLDELTDINNLSIPKAKKKIDEYMSKLSQLLHVDSEQLQSAFGFDDTDTQPLINNVKDKLQDDFDDKVGELTLDELQIAAEKIEVPDGVLLSWDELLAKIKEVKKETSNGGETKHLSFKQAWKSLDNVDSDSDQKDLKKDLLELAKQGKLTESAFNKTTGAKTWLDQIGISAEEAVKKINNLKEVSSADQLSSMKSGISSISGILGDKKENLSDKKTKNTGIGIDTLGSMPEDVKSCTKAYENFCEVLGNGASTMADCRKAANRLATAYVNSNNFLAQLTESNKDYYISVLREMGVENADIIVKSVLKQKEAELNAEKQWARATTINLTDATYDEITALANEQKWSEETKNALYRLALQKQTVNGVSLNTTADIDSLSAMVDAIGGTTTALAALKKLMENPSSVSTPEMAEAVRKAKAEIEAAKNKSASVQPDIPKISVNPTGYNPSSGTGKNKKDKTQKAKDSKQLIDWIARKLDVLQEKIDLTKAKFENLFTVKKKQNNLDNQIKKTTNLLNKEEKAATKYRKKADNIKLSDSLKNNVKNGKIKGSLSELIKEYGEKTANRISKYQDYINKVNEAKKAVAELKAEIRELTKQKLELKIDDNERKRTYYDAKYSNATTASAKNKILNKEISTYKSDYKAYQTYYKDAKKLRNQSGKEAKSAVNNTKGLSKSVKNKIKNLIKKGKEIPSNLLKKVEKVSKSAHKKLLDYNNNVDFAADALRDKNLAKEEKETNVREAKIEKKQNLADRAEAKYNLNKQY